MLKIVTEPDPILHQRCQTISKFNSELKELAEKMRKIMHQERGIGLAAPQVGIDKRLTVIEYIPEESEGEPAGETRSLTGKKKTHLPPAIPFLAICNPKITWESPQKIEMTEGCLSIPDMEGEVIRPKRVRVKAQDLVGNKIIIKASGLLARIIQHEIDHLNGVLFSEKLKPGTELRLVESSPRL